MSLFIPFKPHHPGLTNNKRKPDGSEISRPNSPSRDGVNTKPDSKSSSQDGDLFSFSNKRRKSDSMEHIDIITQAVGEDGGDPNYRDIAAQLEELLNRESETESHSLTSKDMDEEGGFTSSMREHTNLFGTPTKPQNINMDFLNETLEQKGKPPAPSRNDSFKKPAPKKGHLNRFS